MATATGVGHADHQVHLIGDEVGDDLVHDGGVGVAVVIADVEGDTLLLADGLELGLDVGHDLVQGRIVHIVADANLIGGGSGRVAVGLCIAVGLFAAGKQGQASTAASARESIFFTVFFFISDYLQNIICFRWRMEGPLPAAGT